MIHMSNLLLVNYEKLLKSQMLNIIPNIPTGGKNGSQKKILDSNVIIPISLIMIIASFNVLVILIICR